MFPAVKANVDIQLKKKDAYIPFNSQIYIALQWTLQYHGRWMVAIDYHNWPPYWMIHPKETETCSKSVVFSNTTDRHDNWNIVESCVKNHNRKNITKEINALRENQHVHVIIFLKLLGRGGGAPCARPSPLNLEKNMIFFV